MKLIITRNEMMAIADDLVMELMNHVDRKMAVDFRNDIFKLRNGEKLQEGPISIYCDGDDKYVNGDYDYIIEYDEEFCIGTIKLMAKYTRPLTGIFKGIYSIIESFEFILEGMLKEVVDLYTKVSERTNPKEDNNRATEEMDI